MDTVRDLENLKSLWNQNNAPGKSGINFDKTQLRKFWKNKKFLSQGTPDLKVVGYQFYSTN